MRSKTRNKKKNLNIIKNMVSAVKENVKNRELYERLINILYNATEDTAKVMTDGATITVKEKRGNYTSISFIPSIEAIEAINIDEIIYDGEGMINTLVEFYEDTITVTKKSSTRYKKAHSKKCSSIGNKVSKKTYIDNQLRYLYELESYTSFDLDKPNSCANFIELYIDENNTAVKRDISIDEGFFLPTNASYSETDCCDETPFNDMEDKRSVYLYGMKKSTEEVFNNFAQSQKEVLKKKLNQTHV